MAQRLNYYLFLRDRARRAAPRLEPGELGTLLEMRNRRALLAWLTKWLTRSPHPDAWEGIGRARAFFDLSLEMKRRAAYEWLAERDYERRLARAALGNPLPRNVLRLPRRK